MVLVGGDAWWKGKGKNTWEEGGGGLGIKHRSRPAPSSGLGSKSHALPEPSLDCGSLASGKHTNSFCWVNEVDDWEES